MAGARGAARLAAGVAAAHARLAAQHRGSLEVDAVDRRATRATSSCRSGGCSPRSATRAWCSTRWSRCSDTFAGDRGPGRAAAAPRPPPSAPSTRSPSASRSWCSPTRGRTPRTTRRRSACRASRLAVVPVGRAARAARGRRGAGRSRHGEPLTVLQYGKWSPLHGADVVLGAAELLRAEPFRFVLIGEGQLSAELRGAIAARGLTNVSGSGSCPPRSCAATRLPPTSASASSDGSEKAARVVPNKVFDALACGRPVVTADSDGAREWLRDGETALLTPAGDAGRSGGRPAPAARRAASGRGSDRPALGLYRRAFTPAAVAGDLLAALEARVTAAEGTTGPPRDDAPQAPDGAAPQLVAAPPPDHAPRAGGDRGGDGLLPRRLSQHARGTASRTSTGRSTPAGSPLSGVAFLAFYFAQAAFWWLLLRGCGAPSPFWPAASVWGKSILARYVPGNVFMFVGRAWMSHSRGLPVERVTAAMVYEQALGVCARAARRGRALPLLGVPPRAHRAEPARHPGAGRPHAPARVRPGGRLGSAPAAPAAAEVTLGFGAVLGMLCLFTLDWLDRRGRAPGCSPAPSPGWASTTLPLVIVAYALAYVAGMVGVLHPQRHRRAGGGAHGVALQGAARRRRPHLGAAPAPVGDGDGAGVRRPRRRHRGAACAGGTRREPAPQAARRASGERPSAPSGGLLALAPHRGATTTRG